MFGQMSISRISNKSDYLQLSICGLNPIAAIERYKKYKTNIPVILHGDWEKQKGVNANSLLNQDRVEEYIKIIARSY